LVPNPADQFFQIQSNNEIILQSVHIFNARGVLAVSFKNVNHEQNLDIYRLPAGIYIVQVFTENAKYPRLLRLVSTGYRSLN